MIANADVLVPNPIGEPGFETVAGWTYAESDANNCLSGGQTTVWKTAGTYSYELKYITNSCYITLGEYTQVSRVVNFTNIRKITWDSQIGYNPLMIPYVYINDTEITSGSLFNFSGTHTLKIKYYVAGSGYMSSGYGYPSGTFSTDNLIAYNNSAPSVPVITNPTNNSINYTTTTVNMTWNASTDEEEDTIGYTYQISNNSAFTDLMYYDNVSILYSGDKTIPENQQMFFRVKANDTNRSSAWSSTVSIRDIALSAPTNGSSQNFNYPPMTDDVYFSWIATESGAVDFNLLVAEDSDFYLVVHDSTFNGLSKTVSLEEGTYYWKVRPYYTETSTYGAFTPAWTFNLTANYNPSGLTGIAGIVYSLVDGTQTPLSGATVYIRKEALNWSDSAVTGSNGYYLFDNLTNDTVYSISAKAVGYEDSVTEYVTTIPGQRITKNIMLNKCISGFNCFYNQQYVKFIVQNLWGTKYAGVTATVYKGSDLTSSDSGTTGTDGAVNFLLIKDQQYRMTFINATAGINREITIYPTDTEYVIIIAITDNPWQEYPVEVKDTLHINVTKSDGFINVTYLDDLAETTNLQVYVNQTNASSPYVQNTIGSWNTTSSDTSHSFTITGYEGQQYLVNFVITHTTFGTVKVSYSVIFPRESPYEGIPQIWLAYFGIFFMVFEGAIFTRTTVDKGLILLCGTGWVFLFLGFFNALNTAQITIALTVCSVLAVLNYLKEAQRAEGYA